VSGTWALNVPEKRSRYLGVLVFSWVSMCYFRLDLVLLCNGLCGLALSVDWWVGRWARSMVFFGIANSKWAELGFRAHLLSSGNISHQYREMDDVHW
jgi:hypothetical protein